METECRTLLTHVRNILSAEWTPNVQNLEIFEPEGFSMSMNARHLHSLCTAILVEPESELTTLTEEIASCYGGYGEIFLKLVGRGQLWDEFRHVPERERRHFHEYCETNYTVLFKKMQDYNRAFTTLLVALEK